MSSRLSRSARHRDLHDAQPVEEVLAEAALLDQLADALVRRGEDAHVHGDAAAGRPRARSRAPAGRAGAWPGSRAAYRRSRPGRSCRRSRARTCRAARRRPSRRPSRSRRARSREGSRASRRSSGPGTGPSRRGEPACRSRAASSLPVPLSPVMRTFTRDAAARATSSLARRIAGESPTRSSSTAVVPLSDRFSSRSRSRSAASARKRRLPSSGRRGESRQRAEEPPVLLVEGRRVAARAPRGRGRRELRARGRPTRAELPRRCPTGRPRTVSAARARGAFARARSRTNGSAATSSGRGEGSRPTEATPPAPAASSNAAAKPRPASSTGTARARISSRRVLLVRRGGRGNG